MVELLISSGICRYAEFRAVTKVCTYDRTEGRVIPVPCSRGDVFSSDHLSLLEKRVLMKTLALCVEFDKSPEAAKFQGRPAKPCRAISLQRQPPNPKAGRQWIDWNDNRLKAKLL